MSTITELTETEIISIAKTSPALEWKSDKKGSFAYPEHFKNKVPLKVRMNTTVKPDMFFRKEQVGMRAVYSNEYYAWVNSYGALSAIMPNGEKLGLKPGEFQVIEFHEDQDCYERLSKIPTKETKLERYVASIKIVSQNKQVVIFTGMIGNVSGYITGYNKTGIELELWYELAELIKSTDE